MTKKHQLNLTFTDFMKDSSSYFLGFTVTKHWLGAIVFLIGIIALLANQNLSSNITTIVLEGVAMWGVILLTMYYFWKKRKSKELIVSK